MMMLVMTRVAVRTSMTKVRVMTGMNLSARQRSVRPSLASFTLRTYGLSPADKKRLEENRRSGKMDDSDEEERPRKKAASKAPAKAKAKANGKGRR
jgi:hypothetical protein